MVLERLTFGWKEIGVPLLPLPGESGLRAFDGEGLDHGLVLAQQVMRQHASTILTLLGLRAHAIEWGPFVGRQGIEMKSITSIDYAPVNSEPASIRLK